ncbi:MAG: DUF5006 domain-containing protein [Muribaculaceae bacterium]|nr:DUF5006 domain-containing protein [Muribaculaceae bacterium]
MKSKYSIVTLLFVLMGFLSSWAQENIVSIPDIKVGKGKTVSMPVVVSNSTDIVAVQFTLTVPEGFSVDTSSATLTERCAAHAVSMREIGSHKYMAMIYSPDNTPISGSDGSIMTVGLEASSSLEEESVHELLLTDVVLAQRNGDNMVTGISAGSITVESSPDFEVSDVSLTASSLMPGDQLTVNWKVSNVGPKASADGWATDIFIEKDGLSKLVFSQWQDDSLAVGGSIGCNATFLLPDIIGLDGDIRILVRITSSDEKVGLQDNNSAYSGSVVNIGKRLYVNYPKLQVVEEDARSFMFKISRSGATSSAETFTIELSPADSRLVFDRDVTIPAGESEVYFQVKVTPNNLLDENQTVTLTASGNDYEPVSSVISIEDDVFPDVGIAFDREQVSEGGEFTMTVTAGRPVVEDTPVTVTCDSPAKFTIPSGVVIPAGQQSVDVKISSKDDNLPDIDREVGFTVHITRHNPITDYITLVDNDMPTLTLKLTPDAVAEDAGPLSVTAVIKRTDNIDKAITVQLKDNSNGQIYYGRQSFEMGAGVEEAIVNLGPIDNNAVDGERIIDITAAVYISSCSCAASDMASGGVVTAPLTVYDNDGPALTLTTQSTVIKEGGELSIEVSRNTSSEAALTVSIESDHADRLEYPSSVLIPAGETSAVFTVRSLANEIIDDGFNAVFTASADDFAKGIAWISVTDQTLPDARVASISATPSEVFVDEEFILEIVIANDGTYDLAAGVPVNVYANKSSDEIATAYTSESVAPGASTTVKCPVTIRGKVGENTVFVAVNENRAVKELVYTNNSSGIVNVTTLAPFAIAVSTDKAIYQPGETVQISGRLSGKRFADEDIEVYIINDGYRQTIATKSDANGDFNCEYIPVTGLTGHFSIGACYPGEDQKSEMTSMDIYGFRRTDGIVIQFDVIMDQAYAGSFDVINTGVLDQSNVTASVVEQPEGCDVRITGVETTDGGKTYTINYEITGKRLSTGNQYEKFIVRVTSEEGGSLDSSIYFYCVAEDCALEASVSQINTTVTKGSAREYPFTITNTGKGETGKITFSLPSWITPATPKVMASLKQDESAEVVLRVVAQDEFELNAAITGRISLNCESGRGLVMPFSITPVSESTGTLSVDVCDEASYASPGAPHVSGAKVKVTNPYTGALVAEGVTGEDGIFSVVVPEGRYALNVSEESHGDSYDGVILVDPGVVTTKVINLSIQGIDLEWSVEETTVEDVYDIATTVKYEVNVPVPVVELILPNSVDADYLAEGESLVFNAVLINHGLVTAEDVDLLLPTGSSKYKFEKLSHHEPFNLGAKQSVQIPVKITRLTITDVSVEEGCYANIGTIYYWDCGSDRKWKEYYVSLQVGPCRSAEIVSFGTSYVGGGSAGGPGLRGGGGWYGGYSASYPSGIVDTDKGCEPCQNAFLYKMTVGFVKKTQMVTDILDVVDQVNFAAGSSDVKGKLNELIKQIPVLKNITEWLEFYTTGVVPLFADCTPGSSESGVPVISDPSIEGILASRLQGGDDVSGYPSYVQVFLNNLTPLMNSINAVYQTTMEICGDPCWNFVSEQELTLLASQIANWDGTYESLLPYKPSNITEEQFRRFALRVNNTLNGVESDNVVDMQKVDTYYREVVQAIDFSVKSGYHSMSEMFNTETNTVMKSLNESRNSVCSTVTFRFDQTMVMTRQAFRGTLKVTNGHESLPVENFKLHLTVADEDGKIATSREFQTAPESLSGFEGDLDFEAGWTLDSNTEGQATVLFIPTKYAAPTDPKNYSFGGFVTYTDPFTGNEAVRALTPVTLIVSPSPVLDLTYFMQRDVIGDDPLTETVEPCQEAEFSLLINNTGFGDADNVRMLTHQPQVVDNRKGLLIDMELISSQLNGGDKTLALGGSVATDFGKIPAKSTSYAQWWFTSSLLGHFIDYDVKATHVTSYGNPDLSLLGDVTIHELIRSIKVGNANDNVIGFLTNDLTDENDTPDMLYVSDGDVLPVAVPSSCEIEKISDTECLLKIESRGDGWVYGNVLDPTYGCAELQSVVRQSDGYVIPARNFWLTDRTLRDGKDPIYENRIHFADDIRNASESYLLRFDSIPDLTLEIVSIDGVPAEGTVLAQPLESVNVVFNKRIDPATFTADDITLMTQGETRNVDLIGFSTEDNKTFTLDLTALNDTVINGYNVLTVRTAEITDEDGYKGKDGKQAAWVMYFNNQTRLRVEVQPENAGTILVPGFEADPVDKSIHYVTYGSNVDIKAAPDSGYDFMGWYAGDTSLSNDSVYSRKMIDDFSMIAKFARKKVNLNIADNLEGGQITGAATGVYLYGDTVKLIAVPDEDFLFGTWIVNGEEVGADSGLKLELTGTTEVTAVFIRDVYGQTFSIYEGWNWISSYLKEPIEVIDFNTRAYKILGQFSESIQDPLFGMTGDVENFVPGQAYKVQSNLSFLKTVKGHLYDIVDNPIDLHTGWNWISYPYFEARTLDSAVKNASEGDFVVSQLGFAEYSEGYWQGSIETLEPGLGYLYKSAADKHLEFDFSAGADTGRSASMRKIADYSRSEEVDVHKNPNTMSMTVTLMADDYELVGSDYTVYAMVGNECRGVSVYAGDLYYLTVYGDDPVSVTFLIENKTTGETFIGAEPIQFRNDIVGSRKAPYVINIGAISGVNSVSGDTHKMKIYTPGGILINADADFETIKSLTPGIYIIDGRKVLVR